MPNTRLGAVETKGCMCLCEFFEKLAQSPSFFFLRLKTTHIHYLTVAVGRESRCGLARPSAQGLS